MLLWIRTLIVTLALFELCPRIAHAEPFPPPIRFFWLETYAGYGYYHRSRYFDRNLYPAEIPTTDWGPLFGLGAGVRFDYFRLGARVSGLSQTHLGLGNVMAEIGLCTRRLSIFEPYFRTSAGYTWAEEANSEMDRAWVDGYVIENGVGFDVYIIPEFAIGTGFSIAAIGLFRDRLDKPTANPELMALNTDGKAVGLAFNIEMLRISVHF